MLAKLMKTFTPSLNPRRPAPTRQRPPVQLQIESLEDRLVPSISPLYAAASPAVGTLSSAALQANPSTPTAPRLVVDGATSTNAIVPGGIKVGPINAIVPGPAVAFDVSAPSTVAVGPNGAFQVKVTAIDAHGNVAVGYSGQVTIFCSDGQRTGNFLDSQGVQHYASASVVNGFGTASVVLNRADTVTLSAYQSGLTGSSKSITVNPDWFSAWVPDQGVQTLARWDCVRDGTLTFGDWYGLIQFAVNESNADATQLGQSLQDLAANTNGYMNTTDYVQALANKVINPSGADISKLEAQGAWSVPYQGTALQDLQGALQSLANEWFLGAVHPTLINGSPGSYSVVNKGLFSASNPSPSVGTPVYTDVFQGQLNDCTLMASLAEVAYRNPSMIQNLFTYDGAFVENGTPVNVWTVTLYNNGVPDYITVDNELPNGGSLYANPENDLWAALFEKAYAQANGGLAQNSYSTMNGGNQYTIQSYLESITGLTNSNSWGFGGLGQPKASDVANNLNSGGMVCLGTGNSPPSGNIVNNHCYAVLSYDGSQQEPFTLFNPWGVNNGVSGTYSGQYSQAWDQFTADGDFLQNNFSAGANIGTAAPSGNGDAAPALRLAHPATDGAALLEAASPSLRSAGLTAPSATQLSQATLAPAPTKSSTLDAFFAPSPVAVNPRPLPPRSTLDAFFALSPVAVSPQPLPTLDAFFALSPFAVNPQPLPPGIG
jgi:hypothetical protein